VLKAEEKAAEPVDCSGFASNPFGASIEKFSRVDPTTDADWSFGLYPSAEVDKLSYFDRPMLPAVGGDPIFLPLPGNIVPGSVTLQLVNSSLLSIDDVSGSPYTIPGPDGDLLMEKFESEEFEAIVDYTRGGLMVVRAEVPVERLMLRYTVKEPQIAELI
jgi:hypothetical protein